MPDEEDGRSAPAAHEAAARGDWPRAFELYMRLDAAGRVEPADLPQLADVAYAAGNLDIAIAAWERAYALCQAAEDHTGAAGAAVRVAMHLLFDTALLSPVRGWLSRADGHLRGQPDAAVHAWHAVVRSYERFLSGDPSEARRWARRAIDVGAQFDPAALAIGRVAEARLVILEDEVDRGLDLLEDAGVATVSGELDPLSTGVVYCELVCALQALAQYDLAEQWTEAMERWCATNAIGSLHGRCRVHRAEILRLRGRCAQAEAEVLAACDELRPYLRREMGWPLSELGQIRLRRGDLAGAEEAFLAAHQAGWDPHPGLARVRLGVGDVAEAAAAIRDALGRPLWIPSKERPPNNRLYRAPLLEAEVEIEIAAHDLVRARRAADELSAIADQFRSQALRAGAALARGRVALADGRASDAEFSFTEAAALWKAIGAPYELAAARQGLGEAYRVQGQVHHAYLEAHAARQLLDEVQGDSFRSTRPAGAANQLAREGDYWVVSFGGRTVNIRDLKGLRYLARLLDAPGREFHVLDLVAGERGDEPSGGQRPSREEAPIVEGDAGDLLDEQARTAYRRRLMEIDADLAEARRLGDLARETQAEAEREFLLRELSRAFGLGGGRRRAGAAAERARVAVTRALRTAIARVHEYHPALGQHLERAIRTGAYCSYQPDPRPPVEWDISVRVGGRNDPAIPGS